MRCQVLFSLKDAAPMAASVADSAHAKETSFATKPLNPPPRCAVESPKKATYVALSQTGKSESRYN
jgi:hypothetical protein